MTLIALQALQCRGISAALALEGQAMRRALSAPHVFIQDTQA